MGKKKMTTEQLMRKIVAGTASEEERKEWKKHEAKLMQEAKENFGEIMFYLGNCMDEDMAYWYERGCPPDDCPGFRGD